MARFSRSSFIPNRITLAPECIADPIVLELKSINNKMRRIDAYVLLGVKGKKDLNNLERKTNEDLERRKKEKEKEQQKKSNPIKFIMGVVPQTGFLDSIRNFILYTAMGMLVPFVLKNLPTILNVTKLLIPVYQFLEGFLGGTLNVMITAIDYGYKVHDKMRGVLKEVTGGRFEKTFDDLENNLNTFLNLAIITGLAVANSGIGQLFKKPDTKGGAQPTPAQTTTTRPRPQPTPTPPTPTPTPRNTPRPQPTSRTIGKFGRIFGGVPIIGGIINFALSVLMGEKIGRAAARAIGASAGAFLGSFIPIPLAGSIAGGILGDIVGGSLYDILESFGKPKKLESGGKVSRKPTSRIPRTIRKSKTPRPPKQVRQRTIPGKNVGGEDQIKKLFPDSTNDNEMSSLRVLKKNSSIMKGAGVLGSFLSSGLELMALGQRVEKSTLTGLEKYLAYVINSSINEQNKVNSKMLATTMFAMAEGGVIPASRTISQQQQTTGETVAREIVKSFSAMLNNKSVEIFQNLRREMDLQPTASPDSGDFSGIEGMSGYGTPEEQALLKAIRFAEGTTESYGTVFGGEIVPELAEGKMTVNEVIAMGNTQKMPARFGGRSIGYSSTGRSSPATGAYQFMPNTLKGLISIGALKGEDLFTPELQDKSALVLASRRGVTKADLLKEGLSAAISAKLAPEWASFPTASGGSYYSNQSVKRLSEIQAVYKQSLSGDNIRLSGAGPISVGKSILAQGFDIWQNRFFTRGKGFDPTGTSPVGRHANSADHAEHSLDIIDMRGTKQEGIERLKKLFKSLYAKRKEYGITELIFDPVGKWFEGMDTYSTTPQGGHSDHLHVRFKTPASRERSRMRIGNLLSSNNTNERVISGDQINIAQSPKIERNRNISVGISKEDPSIVKEKTVFIQPVLLPA